jgi:ketosteroid isomerase-like protein
VPSANLDRVRSIYAAWERGDFRSVESADSEVELVIADGPTPGRWTGLAGVAEGMRQFLSAWEHFHPEVEEHRELDAQRVLVLTRYSGRGKTSGLELDRLRFTGQAQLLHVHGGKVTKVVNYWDRERALADLGLAPEDDPQR